MKEGNRNGGGAPEEPAPFNESTREEQMDLIRDLVKLKSREHLIDCLRHSMVMLGELDGKVEELEAERDQARVEAFHAQADLKHLQQTTKAAMEVRGGNERN